jgi:NTE family protein
MLVEIDRARFEELVRHHPSLALELAGLVARRLHERTTRAGTVARVPKVVALRPLDDAPAVSAFCDALARALGRGRRLLDLSPDGLAAQGAPSMQGAGGALSEGLRHWISDAEDDHDCVLLRCAPGRTPWTDFATRQADLVLQVALAAGEPDLRDFELDGGDAGADPALSRRALVLLHGAGEAVAGTGRWISRRRLDYHLHVRGERGEDVERVARILSGTAFGLVLGGGAARGFAHLGVYRAMVECGIPVDWIGGTSIGAILGAGIAKDLGPREATVRARRAFVDGRPFGDYTIPLVSLLSGRRMVRLSQEHLAGEIEDLPLPFFCVSSNMNTGRINVHERGAIWRAISASAALPGVLPPVVHDAELAVDGAVLNNLPVDVMFDRPVGHVFAVELSARDAQIVDYEDLPSPWTLLRSRLLPFGRRYQVPGLATVLLKSSEIGTRAKALELGERADLLLAPPVREFGMMNVGQFDRVVEAGYRHALERIRAWQAGSTGAPASP